jgi:hypothetical protein
MSSVHCEPGSVVTLALRERQAIRETLPGTVQRHHRVLSLRELATT